MRGLTVALVMVLFVVAGAAHRLSAQAYVFGGGGVTIPSSDYSNEAEAGWTGTAGVLLPIGEGFLVGGQGFYGRNSHPDIDGARTDLLGALGLVYRTFGAPDGITPFASLGLGYMKQSYKSDATPDLEPSASGLAMSGGVGVEVPLGSLRGFVSGVYTFGLGDIDGTKFVSANVGIGIPLGGGM